MDYSTFFSLASARRKTRESSSMTAHLLPPDSPAPPALCARRSRPSGLTGPQSEAVQRRSQGGPVHTFSLLGFRDSSQRGASTEQRTSRFIVPCVPHRAKHCNDHTVSSGAQQQRTRGTSKGEGGSYASSRFPPAALGVRGRAPAGYRKRWVRLYLCCLFTLGPRAPMLQDADAWTAGQSHWATGPVSGRL